VIRWLAGTPAGPAFCKWHQDGHAHAVKRPPAHSGPLISREEFGKELDEAIQCCGGLIQLRHNLDYLVALQLDDDRRKETLERHNALQKRLAELFPNLAVEDQNALLARYPGLFGRPL
jgi:hypothetical protein